MPRQPFGYTACLEPPPVGSPIFGEQLKYCVHVDPNEELLNFSFSSAGGTPEVTLRDATTGSNVTLKNSGISTTLLNSGFSATGDVTGTTSGSAQVTLGAGLSGSTTLSESTRLDYSVHVAAYSSYWHAFRVTADETTHVPGYGDVGTSVEGNFEFGQNQGPDSVPQLIPELALEHAFEGGAIGFAAVLAFVALAPAGE